MKSADVFPSRWLAAADLGDDEPTLVIDRVLMEEITDREQKPVMYFRSDKFNKGMIVNKTNWRRIEYILKSDDSDNWPGKRIKLYVELVDMQGQMKPALRVKAPDRQPQQQPPQQKQPSAQRIAHSSGMQFSSGPQSNSRLEPPFDDEIPL